MVAGWLLIDAGNTRIKWTLTSSAGFVSGASRSIKSLNADVLDQFFESIGPLNGVALSNVAGSEVEALIAEYVARRWNVALLVACPQASGGGVISGYENPAALGVDRWLGLLAARSRGHLPVLVVDLGSACTLDMLDQTGRHLGGYILPGVVAMGDALIRGTQGIHQIGGRGAPFTEPGCDTSTGSAAGVWIALVGAVDRALGVLEERTKSSASLLLTGGDADALGSLIKRPFDLAPHLIFEGLYLHVMERNDLSACSTDFGSG